MLTSGDAKCFQSIAFISLLVFSQGSASSSNVLAAISIPANLSKILASIKDKTNLPSSADDGDEEYNPEDDITATSSFGTSAVLTQISIGISINDSFPAASKKPRSKGRLAHLSEAELLSMVPDNLAGVIPRSSRTRHQLAQSPLTPTPCSGPAAGDTDLWRTPGTPCAPRTFFPRRDH